MRLKDFPLWTAVITPMNSDGSVDYKSFERTLKHQEKAGIGILVFGSTGEGLNLSSKEKKEILKFAKSLKLEVPIMAGIGGHMLEEQIELIKICDDLKADALLLVTPIYAKPKKEGQFEWFDALMSITKSPCMIYNVPSRTGVKLDPEVPARLSKKYSNVMGVKEASGSVEEFKAFKNAAPNLDMYCGDDGLLKTFVEAGAIGLVSVASNCWPEETKYQVDLCLDGKYDKMYEKWTETANSLFMAPNPVPAKVLMKHNKNLENDAVRLPLSKSDLDADTKALIIKNGEAFQNWFSSVNK